MGFFEIKGEGGYSHYKNAEDSFSKSYTIAGSFAYNFISSSAIEISYSKTRQEQTATYSDIKGEIHVVSVSILGYLLGKDFRMRPYIKLGAGYMLREYTYNYNIEGIPIIQTRTESLTVNFGGGLRYLLTGNVAIQGAAIGYLTDFKSKRPFIHHVLSVGLTLMF